MSINLNLYDQYTKAVAYEVLGSFELYELLDKMVKAVMSEWCDGADEPHNTSHELVCNLLETAMADLMDRLGGGCPE